MLHGTNVGTFSRIAKQLGGGDAAVVGTLSATHVPCLQRRKASRKAREPSQVVHSTHVERLRRAPTTADRVHSPCGSAVPTDRARAQLVHYFMLGDATGTGGVWLLVRGRRLVQS